jgi:hypothetical protein
MLRESALVVEPGALSTVLVGNPATIFEALREAFCYAAEQGQVVMVVTLSSAHTLPGE